MQGWGVRRYLDYPVYVAAEDLAVAVHELTRRWPHEEIYGLTAQVRRSTLSVPSNIAEGAGRGERDFRRFLRIALGSLNEASSQLRVAQRLGFPVDASLLEDITDIGTQLGALLATLSHPHPPNRPNSP